MQPKSDSEKQRYRKMMKERLQTMTFEEYQACNRELRNIFFGLEQVKTTKLVMMYYSIQHEVGTITLIEDFLKKGIRVALPVCTPERDLIAREIRSLSEVRESGRYGLREPGPEAQVVEDAAIDLVVLPGVAFDRKGNRLGHGAGYYDRFLSRASGDIYKLGLAYDFQVVEELPTEKHDIQINGLLTPSGFVDCL